MPNFSRDRSFGSPDRRPKPRPNGFSPQRIEPRQFRDRPPQRAPRSAPRPPGAARIEPRQPASGKQRRRMVKATAWRLAKIIHVRPAEVLKALSSQPKLEVAFPGRTAVERRGEAHRLAVKIWRLSKP